MVCQQEGMIVHPKEQSTNWVSMEIQFVPSVVEYVDSNMHDLLVIFDLPSHLNSTTLEHLNDDITLGPLLGNEAPTTLAGSKGEGCAPPLK